MLGLGVVQMVVHFRCFLHIDLKRSARADLQLILFSSLIVALMVGGTLVILLNLRTQDDVAAVCRGELLQPAQRDVGKPGTGASKAKMLPSSG